MYRVLVVLCISFYGVYASGMGKIKIDDDVISTSRDDNITNKAYVDIGTYEFYDHHLARISCIYNRNNHVGILNISVINKHGERTFRPVITAGRESEIYIKFTADYDNAYIECNMHDYNIHLKSYYIIRITFIRIAEPVILGFRLNGLTLPPINKTSNLFRYQYYYGEKVTIESLKNDKYGNMICTGTSLLHVISGVLEKTTIVANESVQNMTLQCSAMEYGTGRNKIVDLQLVPTAFKYDPFIIGLSMTKVLYQYKNEILTLIHYEYNDDEILNLYCYSNISTSKWDYNATEITKNTGSTSMAPLKYEGHELHSSSFKLQYNITRGNLSCISGDTEKHNTTVELIRKQFDSSAQSKNIDDKKTNEVKEEDSSDSNSGPSEGEANPLTPGIKAGIGGSICILVILLICILVSIKKRKQKESQNLDPTNVTYENLPELNKTPQHQPNEEGNYAAPRDNVEDQNIYMQPYVQNIEEMYCKIIPKKQRKENYEDPPYASVDSVTTGRQILPKGIRPGLNYIQVLHNSGSASGQALSNNDKSNESPYAKVTFNESPYAEVGCMNENPYAEPVINKISSNEYGNVFNGQYYANSYAKGNIEPAYCEPNDVNK